VSLGRIAVRAAAALLLAASSCSCERAWNAANRSSLREDVATTASDMFPLRFRSAVELTTGPVEGRLDGFCWLARERRGWLKPRVDVVRHVT
jgi:hypothetical protein